MKTLHHPDDSTLMAYAAGTLDEAFAVLVSCHLEVCKECREKFAAANEIGGSVLSDSVEKVEPDAGSFGRLLEKISTSPVATDSKPERTDPIRSGNWRDIPRALENYMDTDLDGVSWRRAGPGIWQKPIPLSEGSQSSLRLLRIKNGKQVPEHGHNGHEMTLILRGAYEDELGTFSAGDVADLDMDIEHQPKVSSEEDCICLVAIEAPTRFKSFASRMFQPLVGI